MITTCNNKYSRRSSKATEENKKKEIKKIKNKKGEGKTKIK